MDEFQPIPLSVEKCKDLLITIGKMMCVKAQLISTRLLSKEDKQDMLSGLISVEDLIVHVKAWIDAGMPDYANGKFDQYRQKPEKQLSRYRGIGKS